MSIRSMLDAKERRDAARESRVAEAEPRDEFLRRVVAELQPANGRWPGLWTRLKSLLDERDQLAAAAEWVRDTRGIDGLEDQFEEALNQLVAALHTESGNRTTPKSSSPACPPPEEEK